MARFSYDQHAVSFLKKVWPSRVVKCGRCWLDLAVPWLDWLAVARFGHDWLCQLARLDSITGNHVWLPVRNWIWLVQSSSAPLGERFKIFF